jgi:hypothetical protein
MDPDRLGTLFISQNRYTVKSLSYIAMRRSVFAGIGRQWLAPLMTALLDAPSPKTRLLWIRSTHVQQLLRDLATGALPMTHDGLGAHPSRRSPMTQHRRLALLRKVLTDPHLPLRLRITGSLVLLYAQPVSRIVRLTLDDIVSDGTDILLRLGDPPTPVPEPVAGLLLAAAADRQNMSTATNPGSRFLFPGRRPGQPINPYTLYPVLQELGIPTQTARTSAIRQLVLQAPAPVIAQALGYHPTTAHRHAADAGGTWTRYAPGDHTRPQPHVPKPRTPST